MLYTQQIMNLALTILRDNMAHQVEQRVQCSLDFAIVDEVDSILN